MNAAKSDQFWYSKRPWKPLVLYGSLIVVSFGVSVFYVSGYILFVVGWMMNYAAVRMNGGMMPVEPMRKGDNPIVPWPFRRRLIGTHNKVLDVTRKGDGEHKLMISETRVKWLCDHNCYTGAISIGDMLINLSPCALAIGFVQQMVELWFWCHK